MNHAKQIVSRMTNEEKALLLLGKDFWHLAGFERHGLPSVMVSDGPHGLRKQAGGADHMGMGKSVPAVCYPAACATACSFDEGLLKEMGEALGDECAEQGIAVLLGPGANHKRSPLCGRSFEYFSEDPLLSGTMAAAFIHGVQSRGVGACLKHFAANNQETARNICDSAVDERALREIYLRGFEIAVKKARPWTIMTAYNKLNGTYCSENRWLMEAVARGEWGYEGLFVTDWGALSDVVESYQNGLELEMPGVSKGTDKIVLDALEKGLISQETLDQHAERLVALILKSEQSGQPVRTDTAARLRLARRIAEESAVLLKNEGGLLPFAGPGRAAVIGSMAKHPRYQGAGSSLVNPVVLDSAYDAFAAAGLDFEYADGYKPESILPDETMIREAVAVAAGKDTVFVFAGLPPSYESEGFDRETLDMPPAHNALIEAVADANPRVVVVLQCGGAVTMPWLPKVKAVLLMYLGGCQGGRAAVNLLLGRANPCGKLAETFPLRLKDTPCYRYFANDRYVAQYRESIYTGYRYYDTGKRDVLFPFGHGLGYTTFEYGGFTLSSERIREDETLTARFTVRNTGRVAGKEIVQLYVAQRSPSIFRAEKELKAFAKVALEPGEEKEVVLTLGKDSFRYYDVTAHDWRVEGGEYGIMIGASSRDIRLAGAVHIDAAPCDVPDYRACAPSYYALPHTDGTLEIPEGEFLALLGRPVAKPRTGWPFHLNTPVFELRATLPGRIFVHFARKMAVKSMQASEGGDVQRMVDATVMDMPLRALGMTGDFDKQAGTGYGD
jgi:beta-glucosidase